MSRASVPKLKDVMHKALLSGDTRTVKKCLDDGFSINGRLPTRTGRRQRETPLMIAAELGNASIAKLLIARECGSRVPNYRAWQGNCL